MCMKYPEIIITSPTEPPAFYSVPQTVQENLLTANYEQWCALYSMDDEDISLSYVSSNIQKQREQQYQYDEDDYDYEEQFRYEYEFDEFEDDDFFDKYPNLSARHTLDYELNSYNETHAQKYEGYDNEEYYDYNDYEDEEGYDYDFAYGSDEEYNDYNKYDDYDDYDQYEDCVDNEMYNTRKETYIPSSRPRLNYDILSRRINATTDSDVSEESEESEDYFENDDIIDTKIVIKKTPSIVIPTKSSNSHGDFFQKESFKDDEKDNEMFEYMETISNKFGKKEISSSVPSKSGFSFMNDPIFEGYNQGIPDIMSNRQGARNYLTHRKTSSLQGSLLGKAINENISSSLKSDSGMILNGPMKNRKRAFSLNEKNSSHSFKSLANNNFNDLTTSIRFYF